MNTILRYMEANGMKNERIESLLASELDHLLSKFFLNTRKEMVRKNAHLRAPFFRDRVSGGTWSKK